MNWTTVKVGIKNLLLHKLRSLLTVLGVVLGVGSVISMLAIGEGSKREALEQIRKLGANNVIIRSIKPGQSGGGEDSQASAASEAETGYGNYAAANLLKSFGNLENEVERVLDFYFHQCSIEMNCQQLSNAFYLFANRGKCMQNTTHLTINQVKRINAIMLTCGFYDEAGEFAFEVGLPGKSGVGGGIVALLPNEFTLSCWSPGLNEKGNSYLGMLALEEFTTQTNLSIF